ncbi:MAG: prepilin-type N-terminal cleavage/methylation domain-containing protein [Candidatus Doudnabacteria bacterium]|nr:prepilin-type N-terminal cleavage/methylation domain-containing protein [Candidatus Doudnabacteria bacterium]
MRRTFSQGFSLIEVLLAVGLFALVVTALVGVLFVGQEGTQAAGDRVRASFLADEGLQAVRSMRDTDPTLVVEGVHGLSMESGVWAFVGTSDASGVFTRTVLVEDLTAGKQQVTSTVTWNEDGRRPGSVVMVTQLTDWSVSN